MGSVRKNGGFHPDVITAIRRITNAVNSAWDLSTTLELITRTTTEVMGVDSCSIYLLDTSGRELVLRASTGLAPEALGKARLRWGEGLTGWAAKEGKPVGVRDAAGDPRFKLLPETQEWRFKSLLAVPLTVQGKVIGAMNVQTASYHDFTPDEIELLSLIADLAAGALEKAMLHDNMQRQIQELSTLAEVSRTVVSPLYLDEMLGLVVEMAAKIMHAKGCSLMLLEDDRLVVRATYGLSADYASRPPLKVGEGILGRVAAEKAPAIVPDVRRDPHYLYPEMAEREGLVSLLAVPLTVRDKVRGVLACYKPRRHRFGEDEVKLFSTLANQTALAIENATLITNAAVLREMHHRIKNNLQTVAMLLRIQMDDRETAPQVRRAFQEAINRILSIATVHDLLSAQSFRRVDALRLLESVASMISENMRIPGKEITVTVHGSSFYLPAQPATALALAVNELVQNAVEHAFHDRDEGIVAITAEPLETRFRVEVADDGAGLNPDRPKGLGLQIVETLVKDDLKGTIAFHVDGGTRVVIEAPLPGLPAANGPAKAGNP